METGLFLGSLYSVAPYAPFIIAIAAALDILFLTGLLLYGAAMMSTVLMMHMGGILSTEALIISAFIGTTVGNTINYWVGYWFGESDFIKHRLENPRLQKAKRFLQTGGLGVYMTIGRFITFTRPLYALLLGSLHIRFHRFLLVELPLALLWVTFWLIIILQGERLIAN